MTDNFKIVPYETQHGDEMIEFGLNDKLMDIDASFTENRIDFAMAGLAFTLLDNNVPICSGGIIPTWLGNAQGWVISSKRIFRNKIKPSLLNPKNSANLIPILKSALTAVCKRQILLLAQSKSVLSLINLAALILFLKILLLEITQP